MAQDEPEKFHEKVLAVVRRIPRGRVASYRLVGELAGHPRAARYVARVLRLGRGIPWHRVVGADGTVRIQNPEWRLDQIARLQVEGVDVGMDGRLDYDKYAWRPRSALTPARARPPRSPSRPPPSGRASRGADRGKRGPSR